MGLSVTYTVLVYSSELDIVIIPLENQTEWHHWVVLVSIPFLSPSISPLLPCVYWLVSWEPATLYREKLIGPKTLWPWDKIGIYEEIPRNRTSCCTLMTQWFRKMLKITKFGMVNWKGSWFIIPFWQVPNIKHFRPVCFK